MSPLVFKISLRKGNYDDWSDSVEKNLASRCDKIPYKHKENLKNLVTKKWWLLTNILLLNYLLFKSGLSNSNGVPVLNGPPAQCRYWRKRQNLWKTCTRRCPTLAIRNNLSVGTIHTILHEHLSVQDGCQMFAALQKQVWVEFSELCSENPYSIFNRIVTGDETWVHPYDFGSKQDSLQWHEKGIDHRRTLKSPHPLKTRGATVFWDFKGILLIECTKKNFEVLLPYLRNL